jgi:hypothetical protein
MNSYFDREVFHMNSQERQRELVKIEKAIAAQEDLRGTLPDEQIEATLTPLRQKKAELTASLSEVPGTTYQATAKGSGAAAQGPGATAVGSRGVQVGGPVGGSIITGDSNRINEVGGDQVEGDKITAGDISGSGVALGRGAQVQQGVSGEELASIFQMVYQKIAARPEEPNVDKREVAETVQKIEQETTSQAPPNENKLERWIRYLANMAPDILDVMVASIAGPVTGAAAVLKKIVIKVKSEKGGKTV